MANKSVTNPCPYIGTVDESAYPFWTYPNSNKVTTLCPECNSVVAINKTSRKLRSHNKATAASSVETSEHHQYA